MEQIGRIIGTRRGKRCPNCRADNWCGVETEPNAPLQWLCIDCAHEDGPEAAEAQASSPVAQAAG